MTICARSFEIHVDLVAEPSAEQRLLELEAALSERLGRFLYSTDGRSVEEIVLDRCRELGWSARDRGVVHGRPRRRRPDGDPGLH